MHCHYRLIYHLSSDMQGCSFSHNRFRRKVADSTGRALHDVIFIALYMCNSEMYSVLFGNFCSHFDFGDSLHITLSFVVQPNSDEPLLCYACIISSALHALCNYLRHCPSPLALRCSSCSVSFKKGCQKKGALVLPSAKCLFWTRNIFIA